jgi:hypothetical protein
MTTDVKVPPLNNPVVDGKEVKPSVPPPAVIVAPPAPPPPPIQVGFAAPRTRPIAFYQPAYWEITVDEEPTVICRNTTTGDTFRGTRKEFSAHIKG